MTFEETKEIIKTAMAEIEWSYPLDYAVAFEKAIEALEKQMPQKPEMKGYDFCSECGCVITPIADYCHKCGQAIDWSDLK